MAKASIKIVVLAAGIAIATLTALQAGVAFWAMSVVKVDVAYIMQNGIPTLTAVDGIKESGLQAIDLVHQMATTDASQAKAVDDKMTAVAKQMAQRLSDYTPLIVDEGDQTAYDAVVAAWKDWMVLDQQSADALAKQDTAAVSKIIGQQEVVSERLQTAINAMMADKVMNAGTQYDDADGAIVRGQLIGLAVGAAAIVGALLMVLLIQRRVVAPVVALTSSMRRLVDGDLDSDIPGRERSDELGQMAGAVETFRANGLRIRELDVAEKQRSATTLARTEAMDRLVTDLNGVVTSAIGGDLSKRMRLDFSAPELNGVARSVNDLVATVDSGVSEALRVLAAMAEADLSSRMTGEHRGVFERLKSDINTTCDRLTDVVGQLRENSSALKTATGEILSGANDLAERTTKQAAAIEETTAAIEQLSNTVNENAKRAENASAMSRTVSATAEQTGDVMEKSNQAMERISASSSKISNIIGMIDDIAFQTNLLALNASVEAARAGDAGKGFAVVAVEVRRLAQSAAQASSEVKVLIEQSATEVMSGGKLVADATQKLIAMVDSVKDSANLIQEISSASREQASAISEVSTAIRQMDEMTQHNAALVEETNAAIEQTENQANDLDRIVDQFVVAGGTRQASRGEAPRSMVRPAAAPLAKAPPKGIKALQDKVSKAAKSYLTRGNTAVKDEEWREF